MFKGLKLQELLNTPEEWHALVIGAAEVVCPWPPLHRILTWQYADNLRKEYHYYVTGRALGFFILIGVAAIIKKVLF